MIPFLAQIAPVANTADPSDLGFGFLFLKTMGAMVIVLALAVVFLKYIFPKFIHPNQSTAKNFKVLNRFSLEPRKNLYLVEIDEKKLLIGTSDNFVGLVKDMTEPSKSKQPGGENQ